MDEENHQTHALRLISPRRHITCICSTTAKKLGVDGTARKSQGFVHAPYLSPSSHSCSLIVPISPCSFGSKNSGIYATLQEIMYEMVWHSTVSCTKANALFWGSIAGTFTFVHIDVEVTIVIGYTPTNVCRRRIPHTKTSFRLCS